MFTGLESPTHLFIVLIIVLLLFGSKRIPELAKSLGAGLHEFRKGAQGEVDEDTDERDDDSGIAASSEASAYGSARLRPE